MKSPSRLDRINGEVLKPFVREALEAPDVRVTEWDHRVVKGDWASPKGITCRIFGRGTQQAREVSWSLFLKVPSPPLAHPDPLRREPFQRELLLYRSGILDGLPEGIAAPRLLGVLEHADDEPWMWMEDVAGEESLRWPVERFGLAARHFGRLQGVFLAGAPLGDHRWLDISGRLRPALAKSFERAAPVLERFRTHPLTNRLRDTDIGTGLRRLWADREVFLDALDGMPRSLCHGDFCYPNLFARRLGDGADQTVVIDWQYSGRRQIGGDIAGLIADSSVIPVRRKAAEPEAFTEMVLEAYLSGLREAGWKGDMRIARFACLATLALPWSLNLLASLDGRVLRQPPGEENRLQLEQRLDEYVRNQSFLLALADQARGLLDIVRRSLPEGTSRRG